MRSVYEYGFFGMRKVHKSSKHQQYVTIDDLIDEREDLSKQINEKNNEISALKSQITLLEDQLSEQEKQYTFYEKTFKNLIDTWFKNASPDTKDSIVRKLYGVSDKVTSVEIIQSATNPTKVHCETEQFK